MALTRKEKVGHAAFTFILYTVAVPALLAVTVAYRIGLYNPDSNMHPGY